MVDNILPRFGRGMEIVLEATPVHPPLYLAITSPVAPVFGCRSTIFVDPPDTVAHSVS
jgi:hypothetical protein